MTIVRQEIIFYEVEDDIDTKQIKIPDVIKTDINFELMFGIRCPRHNWSKENKKREKIEFLNIYETYLKK